jgi:RNA polymerase sigma factor (sigma-70 family)
MPIHWTGQNGPVHGPYAEAWFDEANQVHRVRLTAEGRRKVADYLDQYPHPVALLISTWPSAYRAARAARLSDEEIDSACLEGVALAFARFDPSRGASISTAIVWGIRASLGHSVRQARRASAFVELKAGSEGWNAEERTALSAVHASFAAANEVTHYLAISQLTPRERSALSLRFGLAEGKPLNNTAIAAMLGLSSERIRQLHEKAIRKIRQTLGLDRDWVATARSRILAYLTSRAGTRPDELAAVSTAASKAQICQRTGLPMWQLRVVLPALLRDGLVTRERRNISRKRWCVVFRVRPSPQQHVPATGS